MKKIETIWHHLLLKALAEKKFQHTQQELSFTFGYSLSTIHHALKIPVQIGAVKKSSKFFVLSDFQKLLYLWASVRNLQSQIAYKVYYEKPIMELEGMIPSGGIYACYSAGKIILGEPPADYDKLYFYYPKETIEVVQKRFQIGIKTKRPNIFVLNMTPTMPKYGPYTTLPQTFVDIWNLSDWYAKDFCKALEEKMYGLLS